MHNPKWKRGWTISVDEDGVVTETSKDIPKTERSAANKKAAVAKRKRKAKRNKLLKKLGGFK